MPSSTGCTNSCMSGRSLRSAAARPAIWSSGTVMWRIRDCAGPPRRTPAGPTRLRFAPGPPACCCGCSCCCCLLPRRSRAGGAGYMHCHGAHARGCCVQRDGSLWHTWYTGYAVLGGAVAARLARRVVVLALVRDAHERLVITVFLDMLAHGAAWVGALVVGAGVGAVLDHLLPILAPLVAVLQGLQLSEGARVLLAMGPHVGLALGGMGCMLLDGGVRAQGRCCM
mmetsp:Transcript_9348/g.25173  ORF Transcript_9348/g.25173 Transcript_9348/m.25173 type:complete len:226 (-) Transcript_9348:180-857(-)